MDVLCIGHVAWDINVFVDGYPAENSKSEIDSMLQCGGGPAGNAAYLLSLWGASCGIAAPVGTDAYGRQIVDEFRSAGVDLACLDQSDANVTPVSVIVVNQQNGSRTIINRKSPSRGEPMRLRPTSAGVGPSVLLFDGHELRASLEALERFPRAKTILDAGSLRDGTRELATRVDYLVSSERFACQFSGVSDLESPENQAQALASLFAHNGRPVIVTRGERGMLRGDGNRVERFAAFSVNAVDTTAAGDIFHGAFAYGILTGLSVEETLRLAAAASALSVTVRGGRTSIPTLAEVHAMLRRAG